MIHPPKIRKDSTRRSHPPIHPRRLSSAALCVLILLLQGGCALRGEGVRPDPETGGAPEPTVLEVENQNFRDARIYVIWEGVRTRVGMVVGNTTEVFRFEKKQGQLLRVEVVFIAGGGFTTDEMQMWPGEVARLVIPPVVVPQE